MICKTGISAELEADLEEFDRIILVDMERTDQKVLEDFYESEAFKKTRSRILILSEEEFLTLYRMYEFSNKVFLFSQEDSFGGLYNYVKTGILTVEEAISAFLQVS